MSSSKNTSKVKNNSGTDMEAKIVELREDLRALAETIEKVEDEKQLVEDQLKKALADYQNLEKSIDNRVEMRVVGVKKDLSAGVVGLLDDVKFAQQARENLQLSEDEASWADGMINTLRKMEKVLGNIGITKVVADVGTEFDSSIHEAVAVVEPQADDQPGTIKEVVQEGYMLGEFVVRPTRVVVIKK